MEKSWSRQRPRPVVRSSVRRLHSQVALDRFIPIWVRCCFCDLGLEQPEEHRPHHRQWQRRPLLEGVRRWREYLRLAFQIAEFAEAADNALTNTVSLMSMRTRTQVLVKPRLALGRAFGVDQVAYHASVVGNICERPYRCR